MMIVFINSTSMISSAVEFSSSLEQITYKIISDPTPNIDTGEGVKGYIPSFVVDLKNLSHFGITS